MIDDDNRISNDITIVGLQTEFLWYAIRSTQPKGKKMANVIPCRICGSPTRYSGTTLGGLVTCDKPECREASRLIKNSKLKGNWAGIPKISVEEKMLSPHLEANGWVPQYKFVPFVAGLDAPRTYHLDFAVPEKKLALEIDGSIHRDRQQRDTRKNEILIAQGWQIIRLTAEEVRNAPDEIVNLLIALAKETSIVKPTAEPIKTCTVCGTIMPRPPHIPPQKWTERVVCSEICRRIFHNNAIRGRASSRKGITLAEDKRRRTYIPCRICGGPTKIQGTPAHPRWNNKSCDKPECREASKLIMLQNRSAALRGNQQLIDSTKKAWSRRKTAGHEPPDSV